MKIVRLIVACVILMWAVPAIAEPPTLVYRWVSETGSLCWTNDETRIPNKYVKTHTRYIIPKLEDYIKYTKAESFIRLKPINDRLESLGSNTRVQK